MTKYSSNRFLLAGIALLLMVVIPTNKLSGQSAPALATEEKSALVELYNATNGKEWKPSWNRWDLSKDPSTWKGVKIKDGHVISLDLNGRRMRGDIPSSIGNLKELTVLKLNGNGLTSMPKEVFSLRKLKQLWFYENNYDLKKTLKFSLPETIDLPELEEFYGHSNLIEGQLPKTINMPKVKVIALGDNNLTGSIPEAITKLPALQTLDLRMNNFTGEIPQDWSKSQSLVTLVFEKNKNLKGKFPTSLTQIPTLQQLSIQECGITGEIPSNIGNLKKLTFLATYGSPLNGKIPESIGELSELKIFAPGESNISGPLPESMRKLKNLERLLLVDMPLGGEVPEWIGELSNLYELRMAKCKLTGPLPTSIIPSGEGKNAKGLAKLILLDFSYNELEGEIPLEYNKLTELTTLYLSNNRLTGNPTAMFVAGNEPTNFIHLVTLELHNNQFYGEIGRLFENPNKRRTRITISNNNFEGAILTRGAYSDYGLLTGFTSENVRIDGNRFVFEDFENFGDQLAPGAVGKDAVVVYTPQQKFGEEKEIKANVGQNIVLEAKLNNPTNITQDKRLDFANKYQWYHEDKKVDGATNATYEITSLNENNFGKYYCKVTNQIAPRLTLISNTITITNLSSSELLNAQINKLAREGDVLSWQGATEMRIYDITGRMVRLAKGSKLNISHLQEGAYIVLVVDNCVKHSTKIIL